MSVRVRRSEWCLGDLEHYAAWYDREAGWELAMQTILANSALAQMTASGSLATQEAIERAADGFGSIFTGGAKQRHFYPVPAANLQ